MMNPNKRIFYYDALRALAIIGIVFCHTAVYFMPFSLNNVNLYGVAFLDCLRDFSIPIFVMLSGTLLLNRHESFKLFFKKRLSRLLIPFVFWVLIYFIYSDSYTSSNFFNIFLGTTGTLGVTFWFVWMIIVMYFGIFIINKIVSHTDKPIIPILTAISLIYFAVIHIGLVDPFSSRLLYFSSFITYIIIGYFIAHNDFVGERIGVKYMVSLSFVASLMLYFYYVFGFVVPNSFDAGRFVYIDYFSPLLLIISANIFVFFKYLSKTSLMEKIESGLTGKGLKVISRYSFGIYLVHYLIIDIIKTNVLAYHTNLNPFLGTITVAVVALILSMLIVCNFNIIPFLKKFSGAN